MAEPLDELIRFKLTQAQRTALERLAAAEGLTPSAWLRRLIMQEAGMLPNRPKR